MTLCSRQISLRVIVRTVDTREKNKPRVDGSAECSDYSLISNREPPCTRTSDRASSSPFQRKLTRSHDPSASFVCTPTTGRPTRT
jgi:hypothetical protein